jgi:hypothetical protein
VLKTLSNAAWACEGPNPWRSSLSMAAALANVDGFRLRGYKNLALHLRRLSRVKPLGRFATTKLAGEGSQVVAGDNLGAAT